MRDEIDELKTFRADTPAPTMTAWARAEEAIAAARRQPRRRRRERPSARALIALLAVPVLAAAILVALTLHSGPTNATGAKNTTDPSASVDTTLTWSLTGYLVPKGYRLDTHGPVPGSMTCPTATTCYVEGSTAGFYVSTDGAHTWRAIPLPSGFSFTSQLVCQTATTCEAGVVDGRRPALARTTDGGRTWAISQLPAAAGKISVLTCSAPTTCRALANGLLHLVTTDDGRHFTVTDSPGGDRIYLLNCPTASHCVAAGLDDDAADPFDDGVVLVSDDGGVTWHAEPLPHGVRTWSNLECVDAEHCFLVELAQVPQGGSENVLLVSDDGGATWTPRPLPASYPTPGIQDIACVSDSTCYLAGWDDKAQSFDGGKATSGSTSIAAVTRDAGRTWQSIGLPEPSKLPALEPPDVFMSIASLQCPQVGVCIGLADNMAGNKYAAIYSTVP